MARDKFDFPDPNHIFGFKDDNNSINLKLDYIPPYEPPLLFSQKPDPNPFGFVEMDRDNYKFIPDPIPQLKIEPLVRSPCPVSSVASSMEINGALAEYHDLTGSVYYDHDLLYRHPSDPNRQAAVRRLNCALANADRKRW
jgi:hypothetical protein